MSQNLVNSAAGFSASMMQPAAKEILAAAWARALAGNTGYLAYRSSLTATRLDDRAKDAPIYLTAGTYTIIAYAAGGDQTVTFDGTTIVSGATGEGTVADAGYATGWYWGSTDATAGEYAMLTLRFEHS